jgi:hypothetical protein
MSVGGDQQPLKLRLELAVIRSFKRLSYTPWAALAEFVDNSTQSYFDHRDELDRVYKKAGTKLTVVIDYDADKQSALTIEDNAMGMSRQDLERALAIGEPPPHPVGRSRYGFGLKTAASWYGDLWSVETKALGQEFGHRVTVDVEKVAGGDPNIPIQEITGLARGDHFTRIEIKRLNRPLYGRTRGKIKEFLRSMFREDLRQEFLTLVWMGEALKSQQELTFAQDERGQPLRHGFGFEVGGKRVQGWAGVLARGGRSKAGFSILHDGRVIRGQPDSWRPQEIYGQFQGSNDLVNQRLVGEIQLDDFGVSHTKDDILWFGDEEQEVEVDLKTAIADLIDAANSIRRLTPALPTPRDVRGAIDGIQGLLASPDLQTRWLRLDLPTTEELRARRVSALDRTRKKTPDFSGAVNGLVVSGHMGSDLEPSQEYLVVDGRQPGQLGIVINLNHPHVGGMKAEVLLDHVQHCVYQALAEWRAQHDTGKTEPELVNFLIDALLRIKAPTKPS